MDNRTGIRILLGERRGETRTGGLISHRVVGFWHGSPEGNRSTNGPVALHEDLLAPGCSVRIDLTEPAAIAFVPIAGGLELSVGEDSPASYVSPGETALFGSASGRAVTVTNPYAGENVCFLQLRLPYPPTAGDMERRFAFDPSLRKDCQPLFDFPQASAKGAVALMWLRQESAYRCAWPTSTVIAYAVQGVFECQNRLLHPKDALVLEGLDVPLEFEALSDGALLAIVEIGAGAHPGGMHQLHDE